MKTYLSLFFLTALLVVASGLAAMYSDDFLIGAYSHIRSYSTTDACTDTIATKAREAGFNALTAYTAWETQDGTPTDMFGILNSDSLDVIYEDLIFYPSPDPSLEKYGYAALSSGIDMKFEAEYADAFDVEPNDSNKDDYFYMSPSASRVGEWFRHQTFSNGNYWIVDSDSSGYAYKDIMYRWRRGAHYERVGNEFRFLGYTTNGVNTPEINKLNVRFVFRADGLDSYSDSDTLAVFSFVKYAGMTTESTTYDSLFFYQGTDQTKKYVLTKAVYQSLSVFDAATQCRALEFQFPLRGSTGHTLESQGMLSFTNFRWHVHMIGNLNPWMYWSGRGTLRLDYVEYYDDVFANYTNNSAKRAKLRNFVSVANLRHFYGMDEPKAPNFESFKILKEHLQEAFTTDKRYIVTAIDLDRWHLIKPNSDRYRLPSAYNNRVTPRKLMIDAYPFKPNDMDIQWNDSSATNFVQAYLDWVCNEYKHFRSTTGPGVKLIFIPQTFGEYIWGNRWSYLLPPAKMAKCLQLLPLCYKPDGVLSYKFDSIIPDTAVIGERYQYALAWHHNNNVNLILTPQYYEIQAANRKLRYYAPIIRPLSWIGSEKINTDSFIAGFVPFIDSLQVVYQASDPFYQGYIQAGFYTNNIDSMYVMCVNRRTDHASSSGGVLNYITPANYNDPTTSQPHSAQILSLAPSSNAHTIFGTDLALFDAYDNSIFKTASGVINVEIGPGDGRLLQMCSSLPSIVSSNSDVKEVAFLSGPITINPGVNVTIQTGTITKILKDSSIFVDNGASITIRGTLTADENVRIEVAPNGSLIFEDATCYWGQGSVIEVNGGSLTVNGGSMDKTDDSTTWAGIRVTGSNLVTISDATISNAFVNHIIDSNLLMSNSKINVPGGSYGLLIKNSAPGFQTEIINTEPGRGFYGTSNLTSKGIYLYTMKNPVYISNVDFQSLNYGIFKSAIPYATDSVSECRFVNCDTGIRLCNNENGTDIQQSSFANTLPGKQGTGIQLVASSPTISTSNFTNLYRGILTEFALISGIGIESSVTESNFYNCEMGIESRSSNHRLKANYFNRNNSGIVNHAGSNLNLSYDANNVMMNHNANIVFYDTMPYESTIQLFTGHNDFYHLTDNSTSLSAIDFSFDANYFDFPLTMDFKINASKNWFQDAQVTINDPAYIDYVYVDLYDPSPSMPTPPPENDRLFMALGYESQELYELACATYQAIIDDQLEEEQTYVTSAIDGLYRCTMMIPNPAWELTDYFDTKALQYAIDDPSLSAILEDYLAKVFVLNKDFQAAVDIIQLRIDNPISEIDSLRAVLDLEIVLQLAAMEEDKRPLTTKYAQYQYPDIQVFDVMHSNNWDKYNRVLHQNDPENMSTIAPIPQIQSNYPNPFNPSTTIAFSIPEPGQVRVSVYNIKGQKVKDLLDTEMTRGTHKLVWEGKDANSRNVASGIYFIKLESGGKTSIRKAMLMK